MNMERYGKYPTKQSSHISTKLAVYCSVLSIFWIQQCGVYLQMCQDIVSSFIHKFQLAKGVSKKAVSADGQFLQK
jgi:hypothetical protein